MKKSWKNVWKTKKVHEKRVGKTFGKQKRFMKKGWKNVWKTKKVNEKGLEKRLENKKGE